MERMASRLVTAYLSAGNPEEAMNVKEEFHLPDDRVRRQSLKIIHLLKHTLVGRLFLMKRFQIFIKKKHFCLQKFYENEHFFIKKRKIISCLKCLFIKEEHLIKKKP